MLGDGPGLIAINGCYSHRASYPRARFRTKVGFAGSLDLADDGTALSASDNGEISVLVTCKLFCFRTEAYLAKIKPGNLGCRWGLDAVSRLRFRFD